MSSYFRGLAFKFLFLLGCMSCANEPDCDQQIPHDDIVVAFYDKEDVNVATEFEFEIKALETGYTFYENDSLSSFRLELNPGESTVTYLFRTVITDERPDTLRLSYSREMKWLSDDCGPHVGYSDLDIINTTFDSVVVVSPFIDLAVEESIRIYN